ncbi:MAG: isochorismatase family protein [Gammaproteobacteria bacterium]|nr:isochorismatase family protein [Gammaproteobacteria bacterium]
MLPRKKLVIDYREQVASFDVDAQNCFSPFCPDELPVSDAPLIVPELNANALLASLRLGSKDAHSPDAVWIATADAPMLSPVEGDNVDVRWPKHAVPGTFGFELLAGLPKPTQYDYFVWKGIEPDMHPYGACYHDHAGHLSTGAIEFLKKQAITTVIVGGLATDYCVKITVLDLLGADFKVILNRAACRGITEETTRLALEEMQGKGAKIIKNAACLVNKERTVVLLGDIA